MSRLLWTAAALAGMFATGACSRGTPQGSSPSAPATHAAEGELQRMTVDELAGMLARNEPVTVVDNNGRARYEQGHIPGARWVGHDEVTAEALPADRDARVVFYCYNEQCTACHTAARRAVALGFRNVFILPAGIAGWTAAQQRVVTGPNPS